MENERESLRDILEKGKREKAEKRGSLFITLLIIAIFAAGGIFYIKTARPDLYRVTIQCFENITKGTLETVSDSLSEKAEKEEKPVGEMLRSAETFDFEYLSPSLISRFETDSFYCQPLENSTVTSSFGTRKDPVTGENFAGHHGIDLAAPEGSEVFAYGVGTVKESGTNAVYGNFILLSHGNFDSFYGHLSESFVNTGDSVSAGDCIGIIGSTGKSTGIHLHFEIREDGERVDPAPYLYEKI